MVTWVWIAFAYFMGLTFGLSVWWLERKRRVMWKQHAGWLSERRVFWTGEAHRWARQYREAAKELDEARYQAEGYRDVRRPARPLTAHGRRPPPS